LHHYDLSLAKHTRRSFETVDWECSIEIGQFPGAPELQLELEPLEGGDVDLCQRERWEKMQSKKVFDVIIQETDKMKEYMLSLNIVHGRSWKVITWASRDRAAGGGSYVSFRSLRRSCILTRI